MLSQIKESVDYIKNRVGDFNPEIGIILGTGLGGLVSEIEIEHQLMYSNIPNFPISTLEFHSGKLIFGTLSGKKVVAMQGRLHFYEGYNMKQITFPVRVLKLLGIQKLFVSNASGSLNPAYKKGDLMIIEDHINLQPDNPLIGTNYQELGPRFPDMSQPYQKDLINKAIAIAKEKNITCHKGVYVSVTGPNLETKAEYKYLRIIGADAVGMSTVQEVIVAVHCGMEVFAMSVITDLGIRDEENIITHQEVLDAASEAAPKLTAIFNQLIQAI